MSQVDSDRNLLFGVLALQHDLIDAQQFADACAGWAVRKSLPLAELLLERGWILPSDREQIEQWLERKLKKFGNNVRLTLGATVDAQARDAIRRVENPELRESIGALPSLGNYDLVETLVPATQERSRYTLTRMHAEGGLGRVWLARDNDLNREVALKELKPEQAIHVQACRRFLKEAQVTGQLEHPNIVPVYELASRPQDNQPFYTMRFIRGETLRNAIAKYHEARNEGKSDPLALPTLLQAFINVCQALAYAHSRGVIHRDLKPDNVVLGDFGEVIVLDWGLAKRVDRPDDAYPSLVIGEEARAEATRMGQFLGTPAYMAPEQAEGRLDLIDARTDIYGLGAILYEILAGGPPHQGQTIHELLFRIATGETPRTRVANPSVPAALDAICAKSMAKQRADRYAKAIELAEDVKRWLADEPVSAYRESPLKKARRWARKHRSAVTAATIVLLAVGGLAASVTIASEIRLRRIRYEAEMLVEAGDNDLLRNDPESAAVALSTALGRIGAEPRLVRLSSRAKELLAKANLRLDEQRRWRRDRARFEEFVTHYDDALFHGTLFTGFGESLRRSQTAARRALGVFGVEEEGSKPLELSTVKLDDRERARVIAGCYNLLIILARDDILSENLGPNPNAKRTAPSPKALRLLDRAESLIPGSTAGRLWRGDSSSVTPPGKPNPIPPGNGDLAASVNHFLSGLKRYDAQDFKQAGIEFDAALQVSSDDYWAQYFLALCHIKLQHWGEAKSALNACIGRKAGTPWAYMLRGYVAGELLDFPAAEADFARALVLDPNGYGTYVNRGATRIRQGKIPEAVSDLRHAIALEPRQYLAYTNLARAFALQKRWDDALSQIDQAIRLEPRLALLHRNRARILLAKNAVEAADKEYKAALQLESPNAPFALLLRAESNLEHKQYRDAVRFFDRYEAVASPEAQFYQGRGLAHAKLNEYADAVLDYSRALLMEPNTNVHVRRGWAYLLHPESLAKREFEQAIDLNTDNLEAHAGLGFVLARSGSYREGVEEAKKVLAADIQDWEMLHNVACIFAQAAGKARGDTALPDQKRLADEYQARAISLIRSALDKVTPADQRPSVWSAIASDPALDPIRGSGDFAKLEREFRVKSP